MITRAKAQFVYPNDDCAGAIELNFSNNSLLQDMLWLGDDMAEDTLDVEPIGVKALTLATTAVTGGTPVAGTVILECNAPPGDMIVTLTSTLPAAAQPAVAFLTVPAGSADGAFTVNTSHVTAVKKPKIAAETTPDASRKTKTLTVNP